MGRLLTWAIATLFVIGTSACTPAQQKVPKAAAPLPVFSLEAAAKSTVRIAALSGSEGNPSISTGSGIVVAPNFILTNRHVIANALDDGLGFRIYFWDDGAGFPRPVTSIIASDTRLDLALLYVRGATSTPATLALAPPTQLDAVTALGFPASTDTIFDKLQESVSATTGQVTALNSGPVSEFGPIQLIVHTATLNPGNSGGPLFNTCGEVVAVNTLKADPARASNVFVGSSVSEIVPFLLEQGVRPSIAGSVCQAPSAAAASECTYDRTTLDAAIKANDLATLDETLRKIPTACSAIRTEAWASRNALVESIQIAFMNLSGRWRLPEGTCSDAVYLGLSGGAAVGASGEELQVEQLLANSGGKVSTRTLWPVVENPDTYAYALVGDRLKIDNTKKQTSWELERCTG